MLQYLHPYWIYSCNHFVWLANHYFFDYGSFFNLKLKRPWTHLHSRWFICIRYNKKGAICK